MHPMLHMSTAGPYVSAPSSSSGARYHNVTTSWVIFGGGSPKYLAMPKSAILSCPRLFMSRFDVFRSRCRIQLLCRYSVAEASWRSRVLISEGRKGSCMSSCRVLRSCSRKSMTRKILVLKISDSGLSVAVALGHLLVHAVAHDDFSEIDYVRMSRFHERLYLP